ncbi:MAG: bifunctional riboflavin kinase/FMN adenylyltransferase, partial [Clostridiales bacterium]|nr:bifunctional riboflavin kinase/FMN adenylyltransferase [Clostridiales bacterium]
MKLKIFTTADISIKNRTAVTLGNFDGFHMGHRKLVEEITASPFESVIFTFFPHPVSFFNPKAGFKTILTEDEKRKTAESLGADYYVSCPFTREFSSRTPEEFIAFLYERTNCALLSIGENYSFGKNRAGTPEVLKELGKAYSIEVIIVPKVKYKGIDVSSTLIREYLQRGDVKAANILLKNKYFISGTVERGKNRGTKMGFPTANLSIPHSKLLPGDGVYKTSARWNGKTCSSLTNIGKNPTFNNRERTVETY